jgi:hypothetical protein
VGFVVNDLAGPCAQLAHEDLVSSVQVGRFGVDVAAFEQDPLIKRAGLVAVERIKQQVPEIPLIVEMMSSDWGRDQVVLAAESGADVVLLIGPPQPPASRQPLKPAVVSASRSCSTPDNNASRGNGYATWNAPASTA